MRLFGPGLLGNGRHVSGATFTSAQPIQPRSSPGVVSWLARRTGRQTSGAARWAPGRRAIAGGDGATCITGGDGGPRIIGRRIGVAGATMHGRGRCRDCGAENDGGGQRDCCPARHFRISGLSCRGLARSGPTAAALSWLGNRWGWGLTTPSASGWVVQRETHQIPASTMWISRGLNPSRRASLAHVSRMRCSAKRCAADPGSLWTRRLLRSRVCSAPLRFAIARRRRA
jgi:hypothetical protein